MSLGNREGKSGPHKSNIHEKNEGTPKKDSSHKSDESHKSSQKSGK